MSLTDKQRAEAIAEQYAAKELAEAAGAAMQNRAIVAYFDQAERNMIDRWVGCEDPVDAERLRIGVLCLRQLRAGLADMVSAGELADHMLKQLEPKDR